MASKRRRIKKSRVGSRKLRKGSRKSRKGSRKSRGGCGCSGSDTPPLPISGGNSFQEPASFADVPAYAFYPNNEYRGDDVQGGQISTRLMPQITGGSKKRRHRKKRGGASFSEYAGNGNNSIWSFGNSAGAGTSYNLITGSSVDSNNIAIKSNMEGISMV